MKPASEQSPEEQHNNMQGGKYGGGRNPTTRVERLFRDRELRRINRAFLQDEAGSSGDGGEEAESPEHSMEYGSGKDVGGEPDEEVTDGPSTPVTMIGARIRRNKGKPMKQRLLVVANSLPVSAVPNGEDSWSLEISAGGLVSALLGVKDVDARWIGWAGVNVPDEVGQRALTKALAEKNVDANLVGVTTKRHLPDVGPSSASVVPPSRNLQPDKLTNNKLFEANKPSVVLIKNHGFDRRCGSGIILNAKGDIATSFHVIKGALYIWVTLADQTTWEAKVVGYDQDKDVAILRIYAPKEKLKPIAIGTSSDLHVGDKIYVIGHPYGWTYVGTSGDIGKLWADFPSPANGRPIREGILINAFINPGNSGGPLLDLSGKLIGIITETYSKIRESCGLGFAVPVDTVMDIVEQFVKEGKMRRPISGDSGNSARRSKRVRFYGAPAKP